MKEIKNIITETKIQYARKNQNVEFIDDNDILFDINDQLFYETLLMEIRGRTISYSSFKKKNEDKKEKEITQSLNKLLENESLNKVQIEHLNSQLKEIREN